MSRRTQEQAQRPVSTIQTLLPNESYATKDVSELHGDHGEAKIKVTKAVYIYSLCAALNSCNLGYDIGINTNAAKPLQDSMDLTDVELEIFMGSLNFFAMVGALSSQFVTDYLGRRRAFQVAALIFIIGIIPISLAQNYTTLIFGRVFVGLGVGFGLAIDPLYISEISPAGHRGRLVTYSEIATNVGILIGFSFGLIFSSVSKDLAWRLMFATGAILPVSMIFLAWFVMPESPRWLVQNDRIEEARTVLKKLYPEHFHVEDVIYDIKQSIERDIEAEHSHGWQIILHPTPAFRRILVIGIGTAIAQQIVGIDAIQYYLVFIIDESDIDSRTIQGLILIFLGVLKLGFIVVAGHFFDTSGRKPFFYISLAGMTAALLMLSINFKLLGTSWLVTLFGLALYLSFFSLGMGPGAWLIPSEVFPTAIRGKAMSLATFLNRLTGTIMSSTFLSVVHAISWAGYFLMLAAICIIIILFFFFLVPETKGKSLEDMTLYFAEITGDRSILEFDQSHGDEMVPVANHAHMNTSPRNIPTVS